MGFVVTFPVFRPVTTLGSSQKLCHIGQIFMKHCPLTGTHGVRGKARAGMTIAA